MQCPEHGRYHTQSENVYLEIVDDNGFACQPGQSGRVVITSLHHFATPLLRYDIGDHAVLGEPCPCGREALPVLTKVLGRTRNRIMLPDGQSRFPYLGDREERRTISTCVKKFQYVQHDKTRIEYKIVVTEPMNQSQEQAMIKLIQKDFGYPFDVTITYHDDLPRGKNGKFEEFVSLI